eukprot:sb/3464024/
METSKCCHGDKKISALIGISCSVVCDLAGYLCASDQWNIPVVSHSCSSDNLSDLDTFPTFARLSLSVYKYVDSIIDLCQEFSWHKVGLMVNNIEWYVKTANKMKNTMSSNPRYGINVYLEKFYFDNEDEASGAADNEQSDTYRLMVEQLNRLKKKVRVIIIVGYARDILFVLKTANKLGMNNGHFAFITQEFIQAELDKTDKQLVESINGVIDLEPFQNKSDVNYISFSTSVKEIVEEQGYKKTDKDVVNLVAAQMYDAVWLYAKAMSLALEQGVSIDNGEELVSIMSELKWTGECCPSRDMPIYGVVMSRDAHIWWCQSRKSGEIVIDEFGDRMGNVQIMNIQDGEFQHEGYRGKVNVTVPFLQQLVSVMDRGVPDPGSAIDRGVPDPGSVMDRGVPGLVVLSTVPPLAGTGSGSGRIRPGRRTSRRNTRVNLVAAQMYDAVWLYAKAMSLALEQGVSIDNGEELVSIMSELKWTGECCPSRDAHIWCCVCHVMPIYMVLSIT